jgi:tRNA(fMet)-specific endonuclease VapC
MHLLDTNHCSYIVDHHPRVSVEFRSRTIRSFLDTIGLYRIDEETAIIYSRLKIAIFNQFAPKDQAKRRKTSIQTLGFGDNDLWIAATALQHNLILVSADSDFSRIQQVCPLTLESWI